MTTPNIEELRLLAQTLEFSDAVRCSIQRAADLLQSQAERIAELETDIARKSDAVQRLWKERDTLRAENQILTAEREALANAEPTGWQKIETAPKDRTMFVVRGFNVAVRKDYHYDTDPYCVWATGDGFKRWPHLFKPTHWMPLPAAPKDTL